MVSRSDLFNSTRGHIERGQGGLAPTLDRIAARALCAFDPGTARARPEWSAEAKDRLYRRMFPDTSLAGPSSDAPVPALP